MVFPGSLSHFVPLKFFQEKAAVVNVKDRPALEETLALLHAAGDQVAFKSNIHQKFAVFDQKIVWYGSINLLSFGRAEYSISGHCGDL